MDASDRFWSYAITFALSSIVVCIVPIRSFLLLVLHHMDLPR